MRLHDLLAPRATRRHYEPSESVALKSVFVAVLSLLVFTGFSAAQQAAFNDPLLDHLAGNWVLQGTILGKPTTHDIAAEWVLAHQYLRLHEVARQKKANGQPEYEATVFIGWDEKRNEYVCFWLDDFGGSFDSTIGRAVRGGTEIAFLFNYPDGPFHTTFSYDPKGDSWNLRMDSEEKGTLKPFARTRLTRK